MLNKTIPCVTMIILLFTTALSGADIAIGVNVGLTYDQNNLEREIDLINSRMIDYVNLIPATEMKQINLPYSPVFGASLRIISGPVMLRAGINYAKAFMYPSSGYISPLGVENRIKFDSYAVSIPATLGLSLKTGFNSSVYFGVGPAIHCSKIKITQSDPGGGFVDPDVASVSFKTWHYGWNFLAGAEVPIFDKITLTAEWQYQNARSNRVRSSDNLHTRILDSSSSIFLFGINYYLRSSL